MKKILASIDIGTYTARLLIARNSGSAGLFQPLLRRRAYIHLAEDFDKSGDKLLQQKPIDNTMEVLKGFMQCIKDFHVNSIHAIATGVVREAANRDIFLDSIYKHTGIHVRFISGDEEAMLTGKGVLHSLGLQAGPFLIFDLGGGSTEFFSGIPGMIRVQSLPLGALVMSNRYLKTDPPDKNQIDLLSGRIDRIIAESCLEFTNVEENCVIIGTGGTVITLASMLQGIPHRDITPDRFNGLILRRSAIEELFAGMSMFDFKERMKLPGLEPGRVASISAGALIVIKILHFFRSLQLTVSLSDLLEGVLIDSIDGDGNE